MPANERRLAPRYSLSVPLRFRVLSNPAFAEQTTESINLSEGGVYFTTDVPMQVGSQVELFLKMPREITGQPPGEFRCTGRVRHVQPVGAAGTKSGVGLHIEQYESLATGQRWVGQAS